MPGASQLGGVMAAERLSVLSYSRHIIAAKKKKKHVFPLSMYSGMRTAGRARAGLVRAALAQTDGIAAVRHVRNRSFPVCVTAQVSVGIDELITLVSMNQQIHNNNNNNNNTNNTA